MAAYAALVSVMHIINQIQLHPRPPISFNQNQFESLTEKITFLQDFLEGYSHGGSSTEIDDLERCIAEAAHLAEDLIESEIVDQILGASTSSTSNIGGDLYQGLEQVIRDMDFIKKDVMMMIKEKGQIRDDQPPEQYSSVLRADLSRPPLTGQNTMVGFDDVLLDLMDKLTGQQSNRQTIPIVGMGGIGKTTLARNVYAHPLTVHHFDICAWVTISQEYNVQEILLELLLSQKNHQGMNILSQMSEGELGEKLYKSLSGRRYLIVMDDMWSVEAWDSLSRYFPDNNCESRIMITTRLSKLALSVGSHCFEMKLLNEDKSWELFRRKVFGEEEDFPLELKKELEEIGKNIAKNCKGLPLSIAVIGGLLAKSNKTRSYWKYVAENLNSIVNLEDDERFLKILSMSYIHLPVHLKPCFLYMGVFPEDSEIRVSLLIELWVAEGFLRPISGKSLEVVAENYLKDLIDRNLILVHKLGSSGSIKFCKIHDLLRDICLREAENKNFLCVAREHSLYNVQGIDTQRRIVIHRSTTNDKNIPEVLRGLQSAPLSRSLICDAEAHLPSRTCRLLRVLKMADTYLSFGKSRKEAYSLRAIFQLVNSRYLAFTFGSNLTSIFPSSVYQHWNLQTLIVKGTTWRTTAPSEIWKMPQLRHVKIDRLYLPDPPIGRNDDFVVLRNLQTLSEVVSFKSCDEVVKRIPNITKLKILYEEFGGGSQYCLENLGSIHKLKSLACYFLSSEDPSRDEYLLQNLTFPYYLKKLTLRGSRLQWGDMATKVGSLPLLEVLKLEEESCKGPEWELLGDNQFCCLKFLLIDECSDLKCWTLDQNYDHFPLLERLVLRGLDKLEEIPLAIADIPTLLSIRLEDCSESAIISATEILEMQEEYGHVDFQVQIQLPEDNELIESLASTNFQVEIW